MHYSRNADEPELQESWSRSSNPIVQFVHALTEPALAPIKRLVPPVGGLDFSPMVLLIGLQLLKGLFY